MTAPKDGSDHSVIVDFSFLSAQRQEVNDLIRKSDYAGTPFSILNNSKNNSKTRLCV
jgi:hypothetical protein